MKKSIFIFLFVLVGLVVVGCANNDKYKDVDIIKVEYSYSGGYGTNISVAERKFTFNNDGVVNLSNGFDNSTASFNIEKSDYDELANYIKEHIRLFDKKVREDSNVMDGTSSKVTLKLSDGTTKTFGGYMVRNKEYKEIVNKIYEYIDKDAFDEYDNNIGK